MVGVLLKGCGGESATETGCDRLKTQEGDTEGLEVAESDWRERSMVSWQERELCFISPRACIAWYGRINLYSIDFLQNRLGQHRFCID